MADETKKQETKEETKEKPQDLTLVIKAMQEQIKSLTEKLAQPDKKKEDDSILARINEEKAQKEKKTSDQKNIEEALSFNMMGEIFLKENKTILPAETSKVFEAANKEKYEDALQKTSAIKSALIQSFFRVQENVEMLTRGQKDVLEDFLKLTKNAKEQDAAKVYSQIMEPTLLTLKKIKKAEEISKSKHGFAEGDSLEQEYEKKLMKKSQIYHLGKEI